MTNFTDNKNREGRYIFKKFKKEHSFLITKLFKSGLISALVKENLVPQTSLLPAKKTGLVVRQERIETLTYPHEWSFSMLKDAAVCTLKVNQIANKYGFQLQDAHPFNIVFDMSHPKFVDIGSFIFKRAGSKGWFGYEEFLRALYYPIRLWASGFNFTSHASLLSTMQEFPHAEYLKLKYPVIRLIPSRLLNLFIYYFPYSRLSSVDINLLRQTFPPRTFNIIKFLIKHNLLFFQGFNTQSYIAKISNTRRGRKDYWSGYLPIRELKTSRVDTRFLAIAQMLKKRRVKSIVDLAGNEGVFSQVAIKKAGIQKAMCVDYDEPSIDSLYEYIKKTKQPIFPIVQNVIFPVVEGNQTPLHKRFRGDAAVALALTHHLLLTQSFTIERVFDSIRKFTKKYVFIEFMPLGLWNGKEAPPVPSWYTHDWFEKNFRKYFFLEEIKKLDINRVLFVGRLKNRQKAGHG